MICVTNQKGLPVKQIIPAIAAVLLGVSEGHSSTAERCEKDELADVRALAGHLRTAARPELVNETERRLAELHRPGCAEGIWPGNRLPKTPLEIIDAEGRKIYRFNPATGRLEEQRAATDRDIQGPSFNFRKPGDGATIINTAPYQRRGPPPAQPPPGGGGGPPPGAGGGPPPLCPNERRAESEFTRPHMRPPGPAGDQLMTLLTHENFHNVDQDTGSPVHRHAGSCEWHQGHGGRALPGDVDAIRLARQHMMKALKDAISTDSPEGRRQALAQFRAWAGRIPREAMNQLRAVDRAEGSAEYVGVQSTLRSRLGCDVSADRLRQGMREYLDSRYVPMPQAVDQQAYLLGSAAGFLLDELGVRDWKDRVTRGESPVDLLLAHPSIAGAPAVAVERDPTISQGAAVSTAAAQCLRTETERIAQRVRDNPGDYVLVRNRQPFMTTTGSVAITTAQGTLEMVPQASSNNPDGMSYEGAPLFRLSGVCGADSESYVLVPRSSLGADGTLSGNGFSGRTQVPGAGAPNWNGVPAVCQ